jgi:hypothetical protein
MAVQKLFCTAISTFVTLVIKQIPSSADVKVTDSTGARFEFKLNDEEMIAAGKCSSFSDYSTTNFFSTEPSS